MEQVSKTKRGFHFVLGFMAGYLAGSSGLLGFIRLAAACGLSFWLGHHLAGLK